MQYSTIVQTDFRDFLLRILQRESLRQEDLASRIGVSQATICRALNRPYLRHSRSRARIEQYVRKVRKIELKLNPDAMFPQEINLAITKVWDKTPSHARILARVIESLAELTPKTETTVEKRQDEPT